VLGLLVPNLLFSQSDRRKTIRNQYLITTDTLENDNNHHTIPEDSDSIDILHAARHLKSQQFYDSLYAKASKSKITKELYKLLVTSRPAPIENVDYDKSFRSESFFEPFVGKEIEKIQFIKIDIEGTVYDTSKVSQSIIGRTTDRAHKNTARVVIKRNLLFKVGDKVEAFNFSDSERLLRSLRYLEDARIVISSSRLDPEKVTVIVITKDRFPWSLTGSGITNNGYRVDLLNRNVLGTGNELNAGFRHSRVGIPHDGYDLTYTFRNIKSSFINASIFLANNHLRKGVGIDIKRDFISPAIKYQGEVIVERTENTEDFVFADSLYAQNFKTKNYLHDLWLARSFDLGDRRNIGASVRTRHVHYNERPLVKIDSNEFYQNSSLLLGSFFYSKINYLKSQNIYSFNITEDIPVGHFYSVIFGRQWTEFGPRIYAGIGTSNSVYTKFGYLQLNTDIGSFIKDGMFQNRIIELNSVYITPLINLGNTTSRVYLRMNIFDGQDLSIPVTRSLSENDGFRDFEGLQLRGNRVISINLEAIFFTPVFFYGFRIAPFGYIDHGYVKESRIELPYERLYSGIGGGLRIKNEGLVFNTFEIRFTHFPNFPENGQTYALEFSFTTPRLFRSPNVRKPKLPAIEL
jgi:hypothetical protein